MRSSRPSLLLCLAAALSACGGGGGGSSTGGGATGGTPAPSPTPTATPTPTPTTAACSLSSREDWALAQLNEWYLFPDLIDTTVNKASYTDLQSYVDALVAPARAQNKDRYFTYITSIAEENALINSGTTAGFGFRLSYYNDGGNLRVFVNESFEGAPALGQNIDRGDELVGVGTVGGTMLLVNSLPATNASVSQVIDAMGPDDPGVKRVLRIQHQGGAQVDVTLTKASFNMDPVSSRYGAKTISSGGNLYGYLNLRTFISNTADAQLRQAFQSFKSQGITKVIVDLRYNGGGLIDVSQVLGSLLAANQVNNPFAYVTYRPSKASNNATLKFQNESNAIASTKIAFIGAHGTASASELVMNAFPPYLHNNVALVGSNTYGKPVGQIAEDQSECDDRFRIIAFKLENADHQGEYFNGLAGTMPVTCSANDDLLHQLGDPGESSVAAAVNWLNGGSCSAISASTGKTTESVKTKHILLQPARPNAAQAWMPGVF